MQRRRSTVRPTTHRSRSSGGARSRTSTVAIRRMRKLPLFATEDAVPRVVGGLFFVGSELYDDPRLGVKLRYVSPVDADTKADIYLYDLGLPIPEDILAPEVQEFFQDACGEVLALADRGEYLDLEVRRSEYVHL